MQAWTLSPKKYQNTCTHLNILSGWLIFNNALYSTSCEISSVHHNALQTMPPSVVKKRELLGGVSPAFSDELLQEASSAVPVGIDFSF